MFRLDVVVQYLHSVFPNLGVSSERIPMNPGCAGATCFGEAPHKKSAIKGRGAPTRLIHSCGGERALNLSEAVFTPRLPPGGTPLIKATDCSEENSHRQTHSVSKACIWEGEE